MGMSVQTINYKGESVNIGRVIPERNFYVSVDLGQSHDPTAVSITEHSITGTQEWKIGTTVDGRKKSTEQARERFDVRFLQRYPLGTPYPTIVNNVQGLLSREPLQDATLLIDESGVGRAVGDMWEAAGLWPIRITIVGGIGATRVKHRTWHVSKTELISSVDAKLNSGELRFAKALSESPAMAEELANFRRLITAAGNATYSARASASDDLVLSVSMATWWGSNKKRGGAFSQGSVRGLC
jgi:hypothetical protein